MSKRPSNKRVYMSEEHCRHLERLSSATEISINQLIRFAIEKMYPMQDIDKSIKNANRIKESEKTPPLRKFSKSHFEKHKSDALELDAGCADLEQRIASFRQYLRFIIDAADDEIEAHVRRSARIENGETIIDEEKFNQVPEVYEKAEVEIADEPVLVPEPEAIPSPAPDNHEEKEKRLKEVKSRLAKAYGGQELPKKEFSALIKERDRLRKELGHK